jgi:hypothetical protein
MILHPKDPTDTQNVKNIIIKKGSLDFNFSNRTPTTEKNFERIVYTYTLRDVLRCGLSNYLHCQIQDNLIRHGFVGKKVSRTKKKLNVEMFFFSHIER